MDNSYVFISYAHADKNTILPIIDAMQKGGINLWYDNGIEAGSEWPEYIAEKLNSCTRFVAFISKAYIDSQNCKRELNFAVSKRKELLSIYLEDVVLSLGMEMQLGTYQAIFRNRFSSQEQFISNLRVEHFFNDCRTSNTIEENSSKNSIEVDEPKDVLSSKATQNNITFSDNSLTTDFEVETYQIDSGVLQEVCILKNLSQYDVKIEAEIYLCDKDGTVIEHSNETLEAVQKGAKTILCTDVYAEKYEYDYVQYKFHVRNEPLYNSVIADLSYNYSTEYKPDAFSCRTDVKIQVTNNSDFKGWHIRCFGVFFYKGKPVDCNPVYIPEEEDSILPGQTITETICTFKKFDAVEFYFEGTGDFK